MIQRLVVSGLAILLATASLWVTPVAASSHYTATEVTFESGDGTELYGQLFRPAGYGDEDKTPVVVVITPYQSFLNFSTRPTLLYNELDVGMNLFEKGYSILQVSLRGYGHSEGCGDFGGDGEQMDAKAAIEWAALQSWSTGKVGTYGISYDGWTQVMG
ncbi:MAG: CocE/NonD family hydrolase, partial [Actinomycetota bacterium]|nr:CocE/NonD family hydrolase [Actinomycetota bacterium]